MTPPRTGWGQAANSPVTVHGQKNLIRKLTFDESWESHGADVPPVETLGEKLQPEQF
jgi:hypothetical protein